MHEGDSRRERWHDFSEEVANSLSHGFGLVAALLGAAVLVLSALRAGDSWNLLGVSIFSVTMVLLYLSSTLYHGIRPNRAKQFFRVLDHGAIFLLIAGTYTPFTLGIMRGPWGWTLLGLVWAMAIVGLTLKAILGTRYMWLSVALYLAMGWLVLIAVKPVLLRVPMPGILWLLAGGLAYTSGLAFFAANRLRFNHLIWHLFVVMGTTCHFFAVLWYSHSWSG